jgi:hypothetical protein
MIPASTCKNSPSNRKSILSYKHFVEHLVNTSKMAGNSLAAAQPTELAQ